MRDIKFRAYVDNPIHGKGVFDVKSIDFASGVIEVYIDGEVIPVFDFEKVKLLQFTGLYDRKRTDQFPKGQPIYEGDIALYPKKEIGIVKFIDGEFVIDTFEECLPLWSEIDLIEVIGNVFEDKYLLESEENA